MRFGCVKKRRLTKILKNKGSWIESKKFADLVSERRDVSERHAYNLIRKAWKRGKILKVELHGSQPHRVLYGLPEFGRITSETTNKESSAKSLSFQEQFINGKKSTISTKTTTRIVRAAIFPYEEELKSARISWCLTHSLWTSKMPFPDNEPLF